MKEQIDLLGRLQEKDRELDCLRRQMRQGPERLQGLEEELRELEQGIEADKERINELMRSQRQYEADIEDGVAHIRKSKGRLMNIKNNREYKALLREIEETEKGNAAKEEMVLKCLEELEHLNEELEAKGKGLSAMSDQLESEKESVSEEVARLREELSSKDKSRENLMKTIEPRLLSQYEQIKARSGGIAVALINNSTCSECHLSFPPQMYNELQRRDSLKFCPNCQRIICWKGAEAAA